MKSQDEIEVCLARLQGSLGYLADTLEELGRATIPACDQFALLLEDINGHSEDGGQRELTGPLKLVEAENRHPFK